MKVIKGSRFNDDLKADFAAKSEVLGLKGDDSLSDNGSQRSHILDGGPGNDVIRFSEYTIKALGGDGDDIFGPGPGGAGFIGNDAIISGGAGNDQINFRPGLAAVSKGWKVFGNAGDDVINYQANNSKAYKNLISGGSGDDIIRLDGFGLNEKTKIKGGKGNDKIDFSSIPQARETKGINGGSGIDTIYFGGYSGNYKLVGDSKSATVTFQAYSLNGVAYQQRVSFKNIEFLIVGQNNPIAI
jgi:hypothetical protein